MSNLKLNDYASAPVMCAIVAKTEDRLNEKGGGPDLLPNLANQWFLLLLEVSKGLRIEPCKASDPSLFPGSWNGSIVRTSMRIRSTAKPERINGLRGLGNSVWVLDAQTAITPRYLIFPSSSFLNACSTPWTFIENLSIMG
jgi:hypothetical protein